MKAKFLLVPAIALLLIGTSCVSTKKFKAQQATYDALNTQYGKKQNDLNACENAKANYLKQIEDLTRQLEDSKQQNEFLKKNNNVVLNQLETMSVISTSQAESIKIEQQAVNTQGCPGQYQTC